MGRASSEILHYLCHLLLILACLGAFFLQPVAYERYNLLAQRKHGYERKNGRNVYARSCGEWEGDRCPPEANINADMTDCLGGGGVYASPEVFMTLLHAALNNDSRLLQAHSYDELFQPQLDERCKQSLENFLLSDQQMQEYIRLNIPTSGQKKLEF